MRSISATTRSIDACGALGFMTTITGAASCYANLPVRFRSLGWLGDSGPTPAGRTRGAKHVRGAKPSNVVPDTPRWQVGRNHGECKRSPIQSVAARPWQRWRGQKSLDWIKPEGYYRRPTNTEQGRSVASVEFSCGGLGVGLWQSPPSHQPCERRSVAASRAWIGIARGPSRPSPRPVEQDALPWSKSMDKADRVPRRLDKELLHGSPDTKEAKQRHDPMGTARLPSSARPRPRLGAVPRRPADRKAVRQGRGHEDGRRSPASIEGIPTGSLSLDIALGGKGVPSGRVLEIFGPESSGKTTLCCTSSPAPRRCGGVAAFIDAEHALDPSWAKRLGVQARRPARHPARHRRAGRWRSASCSSAPTRSTWSSSTRSRPSSRGRKSRARWATATSACRPGS